jgi:hypothetical protein
MAVRKRTTSLDLINKFGTRKPPIPRNQIVNSKKVYNRKKQSGWKKEEYL